MDQNNWIGCRIVIPDQHSLIITEHKGQDRWWWKCHDCSKGSGIINSYELEKLKNKGMIIYNEMVPEHLQEKFIDEYEYAYGA